ncbi:vancomycin high temperature exclusion protein [Aeromicrobium sp. 50.2.37]|uniref:SanA/YdcF family protein n=1 Tax=Aeromicrobium sp. 50.2.37 TaxID=2969305 RepID=UPI0021505BE9|nr:ElyC/SanA/YdcF family protein [Aeromicrobium sp. 50.2.37]MCR4512443.1 YdcF family protein [Aeromicrobium sp. 50.2.37]
MSRSMSRFLGIAGLAVTALVGSSVVVANLVVVGRTSDDLTRDVDDLGPAQVVIVPGAGVYPDGTLGRPVEERVRAAVALHEAGLVEKILLSGDNGTSTYNEPDAMRQAVLEAGVPAADVFTDYAGFSTWHTMRRARDVFGVDDAIVVTQGVYAARTVDLGVAAGLDVEGYVVSEGGRRAREWLARVRGLGEATLRPRVTPGPAIPITGDGRASWADAPA